MKYTSLQCLGKHPLTKSIGNRGLELQNNTYSVLTPHKAPFYSYSLDGMNSLQKSKSQQLNEEGPITSLVSPSKIYKDTDDTKGGNCVPCSRDTVGQLNPQQFDKGSVLHPT